MLIKQELNRIKDELEEQLLTNDIVISKESVKVKGSPKIKEENEAYLAHIVGKIKESFKQETLTQELTRILQCNK